MSQIELPKVNLYVESGTAGDDEAQVSKINMYLELTPGEGDAAASGQGHVHVQIRRKRV